jgi:hypothetical protein
MHDWRAMHERSGVFPVASLPKACVFVWEQSPLHCSLALPCAAHVPLGAMQVRQQQVSAVPSCSCEHPNSEIAERGS